MQKQTKQDSKNAPKPKSVVLTPVERRKLKNKVDKFTTKQDAAKAIGIKNRNTFRTILNVGSGSFDNINIIRKYLKRNAA